MIAKIVVEFGKAAVITVAAFAIASTANLTHLVGNEGSIWVFTLALIVMFWQDSKHS